MKIYYWFKPEEYVFLDSYVADEINKVRELEYIVDELVALNPEIVYYSINPLIVNYLEDEVGSEIIWIINKNGVHKQFKDYESLMKKLSYMGIGDALADTILEELI